MTSKQSVVQQALLALLIMVTNSTGAEEATVTFSSGERQVTLLELYTSEGCSSCPPADTWLGELVDDPDLWREVVPVAFHVDYWNYLGWKDQLSKAEYGERQRHYKYQGASNSVYTPGFMVNGREWRGWFSARELPGQGTQSPGVLSGQLVGNELCIRFEPATTTNASHTLEVAVLGFDITNRIGRGENRGRSLTHQFAVLEHARLQSEDNHWCQALETTGWPAKKLGVAAWVTRPDSAAPIQATGAWIPER